MLHLLQIYTEEMSTKFISKSELNVKDRFHIYISIFICALSFEWTKKLKVNFVNWKKHFFHIVIAYDIIQSLNCVARQLYFNAYSIALIHLLFRRFFFQKFWLRFLHLKRTHGFCENLYVNSGVKGVKWKNLWYQSNQLKIRCFADFFILNKIFSNKHHGQKDWSWL